MEIVNPQRPIVRPTPHIVKPMIPDVRPTIQAK